MLEVVQHQQHLAFAQREFERFRAVGRAAQAERFAEQRHHLVRLGQRGEIDESRAVGKLPAQHECSFDSQSRLTRARRSGQRHQTHLRPSQQVEDATELAVSIDQLRQRERDGTCAGRRRLRGAGARHWATDVGSCLPSCPPQAIRALSRSY